MGWPWGGLAMRWAGRVMVLAGRGYAGYWFRSSGQGLVWAGYVVSWAGHGQGYACCGLR